MRQWQACAVTYARAGARVVAVDLDIEKAHETVKIIHGNKEVVIDAHGPVQAMVPDRNAASPTGKMGEAWDIANAALFLASDKAA